MKKIILILCLVFSLSSFASISIVSDLDDTIKITNSGEELDGAISAFFKNDVFTGMPDFFSAARLYSNELHILSASPKILRLRISSTLKAKKIQFESLTLKNAIAGESKLDYKVSAIKKLFEASSDDFILIGDDVGQDPEAYKAIQELYPNRVLAIYIHVINGRDLPEGVVKYWTTFDLFLREHSAGRMLPAWVGMGAELVLLEKKNQMIIPDFAKCPTNPAVFAWQLGTEFRKLALEVSLKMTKYCLSRNSGN